MVKALHKVQYSKANDLKQRVEYLHKVQYSKGNDLKQMVKIFIRYSTVNETI